MSSIPITLQFYGYRLQRTKHIMYTKSKIYESGVDMGSALRPKRCSCKIQTVSQRRIVYLFILILDHFRTCKVTTQQVNKSHAYQPKDYNFIYNQNIVKDLGNTSKFYFCLFPFKPSILRRMT